MTKDELKQRSKKFALRVMRMADTLPKKTSAEVVGKQLLRSATSVAANYKAACRARSQADFISKITIVEEEADESMLWLELLIESGIVKKELLEDLLNEANELTAIFTATGKTAKINKTKVKEK